MMEQCEEECHSDIIEDASQLCEDIAVLMHSPHTEGLWSNGLAAFQHYMGTFGRREGKAAVLEFLSMLRIDFNDTRKSIIDLALCMLLNNRMHGHNLWCSVL